MRVVFDIAELGQAHLFPLGATGIHRAIRDVARALARSGGCELALCATASPGGAAAFLRRAPELAAVPLLNPPRHPAAARAAAAGVRRVNTRAPLGVPGRAVRRVLLTGLRAAEGGAPRVAEALRGADVFHSPFAALPGPAVTGRAARVLTVHDVTPLLYPRWFESGTRFYGPVVASLLRGDTAVVISECVRGDLLSVRPDLDPARVFVTLLAADAGRFHPVEDAERIAAARRRYGVPEGEYLLAVNTLEPHKNVAALVRAFCRMAAQERTPGLSLVLAGGRGWNTAALSAALAGAGPARGRIVVAGYVRDEDLAPLYSGATAFVYPSLYEGFGLPPLEAMQCGAPVVASNTSAMPEVVGDAGILVDPADEEALCQAMLSVHRDAALRERMRRRSLARAAEFSWDRCASQTVAAYRAAAAA